MKNKKLIKKVLYVVIVTILVVLIASILATKDYTIVLATTCTETYAEKQIENPFVKAATLIYVNCLGAGEETNDLAYLGVAHGNTSVLKLKKGDSAEVTYLGLTSLRTGNEKQLYLPHSKHVDGQVLVYENPPKWLTDQFRAIFDLYFDYSEAWYREYEEAVERYRKEK